MKIRLLLAAMSLPMLAFANIEVSDLRCEDLVNPLGIDVAKPRLSWQMVSDENGAAQEAYQVLCATDPKLLEEGKADLWDSGKVKSDASRSIKYDGKEIARGVKVYWTVRAWEQDRKPSDWHSPALWTYFDMTGNEAWQAKWITFNTSSPWLRRSVEIKSVPKRAFIYVNALGYFQLFINGKRVGSDEFAPHVGQYNKRTFCLTYDVEEHLKKGKNSVGIWMGSGWNQGGAGVKTTPCVRAQLEMVDADGNTTTFVTDETWHAKPSCMSYRGGWVWDNFGGEVHDATLEEPLWADADYDDSSWPQAELTKVAAPLASAEMLQRCRVIETITPVKVMNVGKGSRSTDAPMVEGDKFTIRITKALYGVPGKPNLQVDIREKLQKLADKKQYNFNMSNDFAGKDPVSGTKKFLVLEYELNDKRISRRINENQDCLLVVNRKPTSTTNWLVDMGKAMTGTFEIKFPRGAAGHKVTMDFGDAHMGGDRLNHFNQRSFYIFRGNGDEVFRGRFNYASCRYVLLRNVPEGELSVDDIKGSFITTDLPTTSTFECSNKTLNDIHSMMEHTLRCLMLGGYQVDCHSRERYGYGGDGYSSLETTLYLLRSDAFYRKWTRDWVDQQKPDGGLTYTSPASGHGGGPFWPGFLTAATLKHYYHYGDLSVVQRNYPAIRKWFELAQSKTVDGVQKKFCGGWYLGDWASPSGVNDKANADVFIQPYMCYALKQAAELADVLKKADDAKRFRGWADERSRAAHKKLYDPQGKKYGSGDQVTYILPLAGGIVPDDLREEVFASFERTLMEKNKGHLSTGLSGTYMMIDYLQSIGRDDLIYAFASKKTFPSWGYMIENGATATWEHWHGKPGRGCTLIHNCYNSIGSWFIQGLGGIRPDPEAPGFQNAIIDPAFLKELTFVKASHDTVYGTIQSNWKREGDTITMNIKVPANSTATVYVPAKSVQNVSVNKKPANKVKHVEVLKLKNGQAVLQVQSGSYEIGVIKQ